MSGFEEVEELYTREVKEKIDAKWRLERQLDRCNRLAIEAAFDPAKEEAFKRAVGAALDDLPIRIKQHVLERKDEYYIPPQQVWRYQFCGKHPMGTPDNPVRDAEGRVISPVLETTPEDLDPYALLGVIKEELEKGGLAWEYEKLLREEGRVEKEELAEEIVSEYEEMITQMVIKHRRKWLELRKSDPQEAKKYFYSWTQLLDAFRKMKPKMPVPTEGKEENEGESV